MASITPTTDLTAFVGTRVCIAGFRYARVDTINHGTEAVLCADALRGGVWGLMCEEPREGDRGGTTGFFFDYGTDIRPV